ncbi:MAG TPA: hypothetical protein VHN14_21690, partial [Kofleriaceae bacterium]|nr:hypothetical protein [Kofleriaceae bacterium]
KGQQLGRGLTAGLRRTFGSLAHARVLAGLPARRNAKATRTASAGARKTSADRHGPKRRWSREQVLERLRAWHAGGGGRMRNELVLACMHHFGSVVRACQAADLPGPAIQWTPDRIRRALREPGFDVTTPALVAACIDHFGSVTAARASAAQKDRQRTWSRATVVAELQARARRGLRGVGRLLRDPAVRLFGSTEAALWAAGQSDPRGARRSWGQRGQRGKRSQRGKP